MSWRPQHSINLYTTEFQSARWPVGLYRLGKQLLGLGVVLGTLVVMMLMLDIWYSWQLRQLHGQQEQVQANMQSQEARLLPVPLDAALQNSVSGLQTEIQRQRLRLSFLDNPPLSHTASFSPMLDQLGSYAAPDLWLTDIQLLDGGLALVLAGRVPEPALVSRYLQGLGGLSTFQGRNFRQIHIKRDPDHPWLNFTLDTREPVTADTGHLQTLPATPIRRQP
jgi:hypothetical protein